MRGKWAECAGKVIEAGGRPKDRVKTVLSKRLCFKCLDGRHFKDRCPEETFKCQVQGCVEDHNTLLHPTPSTLEENPQQTNAAVGYTSATHRTNQDGKSGSRASVAAATGAGERHVCLGVVPLKVRAKGGGRVVETYALLDSGSEVTLCKEQLSLVLGSWGLKRDDELQGVMGTRKVERHVIDIVVMSMDNKVSEELTNIRTVEQIPVSSTCIPRKHDISNWPYLREVEFLESSLSDVGLIIGVKEKPTLFIPLECRSGGDSEPVAVRYSPGWTVMGPLSGTRADDRCSVNFVRLGNKEFYVDAGQSHRDWSAEPGNIKGVIERSSVSGAVDGTLLCHEEDTKRQIRDEIFPEQLEKLWSTDFADSVVSSSVNSSIEDKRALEMMEQSLKVVNGHFQVGLPRRTNPPYLPNNRLMVERRAALLKKRLLRDEDLFSKYNATMNEYIEEGHAERVPTDKLQPGDRPVWYLPHHPVTQPLKPEKVRVVFDCAAQFAHTSLNHQLLQGPDLTNNIVGVLTRFRQEFVGLVANIQSMFHQVRVEPRDCDALRFLWWPGGDFSAELTEYRMVKHSFGATSSPSVVDLCLKKTAEMDGGWNSEVANVIKRNMYVDDLMKSTETRADAILLVHKVKEQHSKGGFHLTKWCSNDRRGLAVVPEPDRARPVINLELDQLPTQSASGLK